VGCSGDWPARKRAADLVRMTRIERLGWFASEEIMSGSFIIPSQGNFGNSDTLLCGVFSDWGALEHHAF
jgi:hypothetical protein